ncbi:CapA family protein [Jeotgalibaca sp. MA1X17-3]|uniref:CapA family protein n=1 Tax=Jeotgalibaca sp. MA1X17-3 TaxID=2908211 RepID=UPI002104743D|nr:CapA family protein [Jeotgalibaca sp. MA1X17-3]
MKKWMSLISIVALWGCSANVDTDQNDSSNGIESTPAIVESSESESAAIIESEEETENRVSFIGVGDNLIHDSVIQSAKLDDGTYDFTPMFDNVASSIGEADLAFLNQETILAGSDYPYAGYPSFNTPDEMAQNMHDLGFDLINGATNHTLDYDYTGAIHAKEVWNQFDDLIYTGNF